MLVIVTAHAQQPDSLLNEQAKQLSEQELQPGLSFGIDKITSTSAVSTVSGETLYKTPTANLTNTLYGLLPGLSVIQGSGEPGYDNANLNIRGIGSYNYGSYAIFVDGFQTESNYLQYLLPSEIKSVSILKDAAALAPFGMKGANGVLWVETKRGEAGAMKAKVQFRSGIQQPQQITKPLGAYDYASLYNEALSNDNGRVWNPHYSDAQLDAYRNGTGTNTDWYDEVTKPSTPFLSVNATFSGGGNAAKYFISLGHVGSSGLYDVPNDDQHSNARLQQYNVRSNFDFSLFNIFEGKVDLGGRIEDRKYPGYNGAQLWNNMERYPNIIYPVRDDNGGWSGTATHPDNPVASVRERGYFSTRDRTLQANFSLKEKLDFITPGLYLWQAISFNNWTRGSYNVTKNYARYFNGVQQTNDQDTEYEIYDDNGTNQWYWQQEQAGLGYQRQFGKHQITSALNYLQYIHRVDANRNGLAGIHTNYAHQNLGGRLHYSYNDTYAGELSFAYSGSDNYAKENRFGFYPAVSLAWILSNEQFLRDASFIDFLKLRVSAGKSAYDTFERRYLYQQYYTYSGSYPTGNSTPVWHRGLTMGSIANPDIFAEESTKYNLGIESKLFSRLNILLDAFVDKRSGIVSIDNSISAVFGATPPYRNIGKVTKTGIEADISYVNHIRELNYKIGGNATAINDKIDYMAELTPPSPLAARTGQRIGSQFGYEAIGFYDISDFNTDGTLKDGIPLPGFGEIQPGDIKYRDIHEDGIINEMDMTKIGDSPFPNLVYAFYAEADFKGFDFRIQFQGTAGRDINMLESARNKFVAFQNNGNAYEVAKGRWAYYPDQGIDTRASATYPRLSTRDNDNNYKYSTFWMKSGDFLKLRNLEIGYSFHKNLLERIKLSNARIFVSGINLLTFSELTKDYHIDPETLQGYPAIKSYNIGITVGF
jgi:TonB-linked SusC/RagA family outer membrane protein